MRLELKANTIKYGTGQAAKRKYPLLVNKTFILRKYVKEKYPDHFRIWENFKLWPENNSQIIECGCPLTRQILNIKFKSAERNILKKEFRRNKEHQELKTREVYQPQILPEQKNQTLQVQKNHPDNIKMQQIQTQRQDLDDEFFVAYDMENAVEDRLNQSQTLREEAGLNSYNNEVDEVIETIEMTKGDAILASDPADKETEPILKKRKEIMIENIETKIEEVGDDMLNPVKEETEDSAETLSLQETKDEIIERLMAEVAELKVIFKKRKHRLNFSYRLKLGEKIWVVKILVRADVSQVFNTRRLFAQYSVKSQSEYKHVVLDAIRVFYAVMVPNESDDLMLFVINAKYRCVTIILLPYAKIVLYRKLS